MLKPLRLLATATLLAALFTLAVLPGCNGDDPTGALVVGVSSEFTNIAEVEIVMSVDGEVLKDDRTPVGGGGVVFPAEFSFEDVTEGQKLSFSLRGYGAGGELLVERLMDTTAVADARNLVRVLLTVDCRLDEPGAPSCADTGQTCIAGACASATVDPSAQEAYRDNWATSGPGGDVCKAVNSAGPEVEVGVGQSDFFSAEDYEVAQIEAGPQGGYHIWVAARLRGLRQSGSITETGAEIPALGLSITPLKVIFTFDTDEGGYCKIFGLRVQLDIDGDPIETMLGQEVKVIMTITDSDDTTATGEKWLTLSGDTI